MWSGYLYPGKMQSQYCPDDILLTCLCVSECVRHCGSTDRSIAAPGSRVGCMICYKRAVTPWHLRHRPRWRQLLAPWGQKSLLLKIIRDEKLPLDGKSDYFR
jgi:hypothetical protein